MSDSDWSEAERILESLMEKRSAPPVAPLARKFTSTKRSHKPWYLD